MTEALAALASTGGTALVTAMVTDGWEDVKGGFARLFGRGKAKQAEATVARLEQSQAALAGLSGADLERARAEQEVVWRTRLGDLLEQDPAAEQAGPGNRKTAQICCGDRRGPDRDPFPCSRGADWDKRSQTGIRPHW